MKYLCIMYKDPSIWRNMSKEEAGKYRQEFFDLSDALKQEGKYVFAAGLQSADQAKTVQVHAGKMSATDGPFAETHEQFGGFYLVEAASMDEALQLAARIPAARHGTIEVRQAFPFES